MTQLKDLTNQRFGRLTVLSLADRSLWKTDNAYWHCRCDCGSSTVTQASHLLRGHTTSCGCFQKERAISYNTRHGHAKKGRWTLTYQTWRAMSQRCLYPKHNRYHRYGGRGITICDRWLVYENFLDDMGERPEGMTLDRIDPDGNYEPTNCRWATSAQQNANKSKH